MPREAAVFSLVRHCRPQNAPVDANPITRARVHERTVLASSHSFHARTQAHARDAFTRNSSRRR